MSPAELERYLHEHIPLTAAMQISVRETSATTIVIAAPLPPNINHRHTAFGGSISTLATVAAWSWLHVDSTRLHLPTRLVIRSNRVEYLKPVVGEFIATCAPPSPEAYEGYHEALRRKGTGRIEMTSTVTCEGVLAATFSGVFVGIRPDGA